MRQIKYAAAISVKIMTPEGAVGLKRVVFIEEADKTLHTSMTDKIGHSTALQFATNKEAAKSKLSWVLHWVAKVATTLNL